MTIDLVPVRRLVGGGLFFPGDSFADESTRPFVLTGINWSF